MLAALPVMAGTDCRATSPRQTVAVIELDTSEGCDSCPPADRWLSKIDVPRDSAIALSLHVDYWDRLGWKDRFANAGMTARQYEQKRRHGTEYVYTPQVLLQGRDFRNWSVRGEPATSIVAINARLRAPTSNCGGSSVRQGSGRCAGDVPETRAIARVRCGGPGPGWTREPYGGREPSKRLMHDHVVRQWHAEHLSDTSGVMREHLSFDLPAEGGPISFVALAEDAQTGEVLQALALPFCMNR
jgi:hypothetical protein